MSEAAHGFDDEVVAGGKRGVLFGELGGGRGGGGEVANEGGELVGGVVRDDVLVGVHRHGEERGVERRGG